MNCNCISELEKKLAAKYSDELGAPASAECQAAGFGFGATRTVIHKTDFKITADATGFKRGRSIPLIASFCPFCGKSTKDEPAKA